jgi:hypothetical protein
MARGLRYSANEKKKEKYYKLIQEGLCGVCGKKREQEERTKCNRCLMVNRKRVYNLRHKNR